MPLRVDKVLPVQCRMARAGLGLSIRKLAIAAKVSPQTVVRKRPATATVIAKGPVRALAFDRGKLSQFFHNEAEVAGLIYQLLGRELAHKIKISNSLLSTAASLA